MEQRAWVTEGFEHSLLVSVAQNLLSAAASLACMERLFPVCGEKEQDDEDFRKAFIPQK
jgi:hypothetical protein